MPLRIPWKLFQPRLPRGAGGEENRSRGPGTGPLPPSPQVLLRAWPRTLPAVRVCVHLSHQGPVLVDGSARLGSQVQERAGAAAAAPADPLDDLGVGVGQLRQRASQLLLVSAGERASEGDGRGATAPSIPTCVEVLGSPPNLRLPLHSTAPPSDESAAEWGHSGLSQQAYQAPPLHSLMQPSATQTRG